MRAALAPVLAGGVRYAAPAAGGDRVFVLRRSAAEESAVLVALDATGGATRVLFDPAREARQPTAIDWYVPSPCGRFIALGTSVDGSEDSSLRVLDADRGEELGERVEHARWASVAWRHDGSAFAYTRHPMPGSVPSGEEFYHQRVHLHVVGTDRIPDPELFGADRPLRESHHLVLSEDDHHLYIFSAEHSRHVTLRRLDLRRPGAEPEVLIAGLEGSLGGIETGGRLLLLTSVDAPYGRIVEVDPEQPAPDRWRELVRGTEGFVLRGLRRVRSGIAVHALSDVAARVVLFDRDGTHPTEVPIPDNGTVTALATGPEEDLLLLYESFVQAPTLYRADANGAVSVVVASDTSPLARALEVRRLLYTSRDGTRCPLFLVSGPGAAAEPRPTVLSGYGGFNIARASRYAPEILPWVAAGGVYAWACLRGGGEYGDRWHKAAVEGGRQNSFDDFIAAAEYLIEAGVTSPERLGVEGRSLGGLLTGVFLTQRPELAAAVSSGMPLLDMLRYHLFLIGASWMEEYGSPDSAEAFRWLLAYSPYHNIRPGVRYPATYLFCAMDDGRVDAMHARKMAARLGARAADVDGAGPVLLRTYFHAGHGAGRPLGAAIAELAEEWGFFAWRLGLPPTVR